MGEVWRVVLHRDFIRSQIGVPIEDQIQVAIKFLHVHALQDDWAREEVLRQKLLRQHLFVIHISFTILDYGVITCENCFRRCHSTFWSAITISCYGIDRGK